MRLQKKIYVGFIISIPMISLFGIEACASTNYYINRQSNILTTNRTDLQLYEGQVLVMNATGVKRIAIGNGKIISSKMISSNQAIVMATKSGTTDLYLWYKNGSIHSYHVLVTQVDTLQNYHEIKKMLSTVRGIKIVMDDGKIVVSGTVSPTNQKNVQTVLKSFRDVTDLVKSDDVNMRKMIYLDVQVVDFSKNSLKNLGIQWQQSVDGPAAGLVGNTPSNGIYRLGDVTQGGSTANTLNGTTGPLKGLPLDNPLSGYFGIVSSITSSINLAVNSGEAYILANPQLSTRSGGTASFLAGGEVPIPVSSGLGQTSVVYKKYGIKLNIKPYADSKGDILANISTEVSQINPSITIDGYPGFLTRKTSSVVNVHSGQTVVLSGLIHSLGSNTITKFPWLSDIPILGYLFRNKDFQSSRSELVIFVTPVEFNPNSTVNKKAINIGRKFIANFNNNFGNGLYMPSFGVGPGISNDVTQQGKTKHAKKVPAHSES